MKRKVKGRANLVWSLRKRGSWGKGDLAGGEWGDENAALAKLYKRGSFGGKKTQQKRRKREGDRADRKRCPNLKRNDRDRKQHGEQEGWKRAWGQQAKAKTLPQFNRTQHSKDRR